MRYENKKTGDWVEFKKGVSRLSINEVNDILSTEGIYRVLSYLEAYAFVNHNGEQIDLRPELDWLKAFEAKRSEYANADDERKNELDAAERAARIGMYNMFTELTYQQVDWLGEVFVQCAKNEKLDPEV